jgi:hypothetical protein
MSSPEPPTPDDERWAAVLEQRRQRYATSTAPRPSRTREQILYSVPRRFDIATLLVVSLAYSLMFTLLRLLDAPWEVFTFVGLFTVVIGIAQACFPHGGGPRVASMWAGMLYVLGWTVYVWLVRHAGNPLGFVGCWLFVVVAGGAVLGYVGGAIEAGVFLIADKVRRAWFPERPVVAPDPGESDFDRLE